MKPITFTCRGDVSITPQEIVQQILDVRRWPEFRGYGPLPGIREAVIVRQPPEIVGTTFQVTSDDGSTHTEEIVAWLPDVSLHTRMSGFSKPLSRLATHFDEFWSFQQQGSITHVDRTFHLHPTSPFTRPVLWLISRLLRRAIVRHLQQMKVSQLPP